jgi:hypothetical protein
MVQWLLHHFYYVLLTGFLVVVVAVVWALARWWYLLTPVPILLAAAAWRGWELQDETAILAVAIAVFGYIGLAAGVALRHATRRR